MTVPNISTAYFILGI